VIDGTRGEVVINAALVEKRKNIEDVANSGRWDASKR
jgi:hypothetical protein